MEQIREIIKRALQEDLGEGDHTSLACIPDFARGKAQLLVKEPGVLAGMEVARAVFEVVDPQVEFVSHMADGSRIQPGNVAFEVSGRVQSLLKAERLALNFMQRMSGIATRTAYYVSLVEGTGARILDTRKTTPNFRLPEKMAVVAGGGYNHRMGLYDMIMIKDNHVDFAGGIVQAIERTRNYLQQKGLDLKIELEVRDLEELDLALQTGGIHRIMLDNFSVSNLAQAVRTIDGRFETEASGGITEATIRQVAMTGVDFISVGALTHHIKSLDLSLKAVK